MLFLIFGGIAIVATFFNLYELFCTYCNFDVLLVSCKQEQKRKITIA